MAKLLVSTNAKAEVNVSDDKLFLEVYKKIGEIEKDGKRLPLFYSNGTKDSKVAKFNVEEVATLVEGLKVFLEKGAKGFEEFASKEMGNPNFKDLMFPHGDRLMGLTVFTGKDGREFIGFAIKEAKEKDKYAVFTTDRKVIRGMIKLLENALDIMAKNSLTLKNEKKTAVDIEEDDIPVDIPNAGYMGI